MKVFGGFMSENIGSFIRSSIVGGVLVFTSMTLGNAFLSLDSQKLTENAFHYLKKNLSKIELAGDGEEVQTLNRLFEDLSEYEEEIVERLTQGDNINNLKSEIRSAVSECRVEKSLESLSHCFLKIEYKSQKTVMVLYRVIYNSQLEVERIVNNKIDINWNP